MVSSGWCPLNGWVSGWDAVRGRNEGHDPSLPGAAHPHNVRGGAGQMGWCYLIDSTAADALSNRSEEIGAVPAASAEMAWPSSLMIELK